MLLGWIDRSASTTRPVLKTSGPHVKVPNWPPAAPGRLDLDLDVPEPGSETLQLLQLPRNVDQEQINLPKPSS